MQNMAYYVLLPFFLKEPPWGSLNFHNWNLLKSDRTVTWALLDITVNSGMLFLLCPADRIPNTPLHVLYRTTGLESLQDSEGTHDLSPHPCNLPDTDQIPRGINRETVNIPRHHLFTFPVFSWLQGEKAKRKLLRERYRTEKFILHYPSKKTISVKPVQNV